MKINVYSICEAALIAAFYTALGLIFMPISFGPVQCRISEALVILPAFTPSAIPGVTIGCLLTNILGGCVIPDVVFGTLATFLGAVLTRFLTGRLTAAASRKTRPDAISPAFRLAAVLPPVVSNTLIVPFVLKYAYGMGEAIYLMFITVGLGEVISVGIIGNVLITVIIKTGLFDRLRSRFTCFQ